MELNTNVLKHENRTEIIKTNHFYLLLDNDMILMPKWSEYMISANYYGNKFTRNLHFLVPHPGGVPEAYRKNKKAHECVNIFNKTDKFTLQFANGGGSSGFWFCDYNQLMKLKWDYETMCKCYKKFKRHDTETWNMIRKKSGHVEYVGCVNSPTPIALHLGGISGSMCNALSDDTFDSKKETFEMSDTEFSKMSLEEIMHKYKDRKSW
jgi:hypothetical protein